MSKWKRNWDDSIIVSCFSPTFPHCCHEIPSTYTQTSIHTFSLSRCYCMMPTYRYTLIIMTEELMTLGIFSTWSIHNLASLQLSLFFLWFRDRNTGPSADWTAVLVPSQLWVQPWRWSVVDQLCCTWAFLLLLSSNFKYDTQMGWSPIHLSKKSYQASNPQLPTNCNILLFGLDSD